MYALYWLYCGIALILLELITPGFVLMFFGIAAVIVALLSWILPDSFMVGWGAQWWLFGLFSIASILFLRKYVKATFTGESNKSDSPSDDVTGKTVVVASEITSLLPGKVELNGVLWKAQLADPSDNPIPAGTPVEIVKRDNITLLVKIKQREG
jgi:membrane protein implicated in regulation of membrane protease activity